MARDEAYKRAEQEIAYAEDKRLRNLDLRNLRLTELPESLGRLSQLERLDLRGNPIRELPETLAQLNQLQWLCLARNMLRELPGWLGNLNCLETLQLPYNQIRELPESIGQLSQLRWLSLGHNILRQLPDSIGLLTQLRNLLLGHNHLTGLPDSLGQLVQLEGIHLQHNKLSGLPDSFRKLTQLKTLLLGDNDLTDLPDWLGELHYLQELQLNGNKLSQLPVSLARLVNLHQLNASGNPLNPEVGAAYSEGLAALKRYQRVTAEEPVILNEAKLILVGEGSVGKSSLLSALRGDPWDDNRTTTHGIEIKPVQVTDPETGQAITLNGWDFGGQPVYRPTHQLFFSAPAVYLVVWKPLQGPGQGGVMDWIRMVKQREPDAKIIVVATHGGPGQRQPDIDFQELQDLFGRDTVVDFFHVESKPDEQGDRRNIETLKEAIARVTAGLPEMGRTVPRRWQEVRDALQKTEKPYLSLRSVLELCGESKMEEDEARLFVTISHRLGHLIHYDHDLALGDMVILRPDWLATAISFVLDDEKIRENSGLVKSSRLGQLWDNADRKMEFGYGSDLYPVFLRLMERFDLSYRVAGLATEDPSDETILIAQLVPDTRPDPLSCWLKDSSDGDTEQIQICRIVEAANGQSATAEGLFYRLIVRLNKYSLGRKNRNDAVHWKRGLVLNDDFGGRALLEHVGNDVRITVRAPYPERFISVLTEEVKWLVESFWPGLRCEVMVPCIEPCGKGQPGTTLFKVQTLIETKKRQQEYLCPVCLEWQGIDGLLRNASAGRQNPLEQLVAQGFDNVKELLSQMLEEQRQHEQMEEKRFEKLDVDLRRIMLQVEDAFTSLMQTIIDEAREGPRLFSFEPIGTGFLDNPKWISQKARLTLWCEHSRLPLPVLNGQGDQRGVYPVEIKRNWVVKAGPFLKALGSTLGLVHPVAALATGLIPDDDSYKGIQNGLDLSRQCIDSVLAGSAKTGDGSGVGGLGEPEEGKAIQARQSGLRVLHAFLKDNDPGFGGLVRVQNRRMEFMWVHTNFEKEF